MQHTREATKCKKADEEKKQDIERHEGQKRDKKVSSKTYAETDTRGEMSTNFRTRGTKSEQ